MSKQGVAAADPCLEILIFSFADEAVEENLHRDCGLGSVEAIVMLRPHLVGTIAVFEGLQMLFLQP